MTVAVGVACIPLIVVIGVSGTSSLAPAPSSC